MKKIITGICLVFGLCFIVGANEGQCATKANKTIYVTKGKTASISGKYKWKSKNKKVAKIANKKVKAIKRGTTYIIGKKGKKKTTYKIVVETPAFSKAKEYVQLNGTVKLTLAGTKRKVSWSSNNTDMTTIDKKGNFTAHRVGTYDVTAKVGKESFTIKVLVGDLQNYDETVLNAEDASLLYVHSISNGVLALRQGKDVVVSYTLKLSESIPIYKNGTQILPNQIVVGDKLRIDVTSAQMLFPANIVEYKKIDVMP